MNPYEQPLSARRPGEGSGLSATRCNWPATAGTRRRSSSATSFADGFAVRAAHSSSSLRGVPAGRIDIRLLAHLEAPGRAALPQPAVASGKRRRPPPPRRASAALDNVLATSRPGRKSTSGPSPSRASARSPDVRAGWRGEPINISMDERRTGLSGLGLSVASGDPAERAAQAPPSFCRRTPRSGSALRRPRSRITRFSAGDDALARKREAITSGTRLPHRPIQREASRGRAAREALAESARRWTFSFRKGSSSMTRESATRAGEVSGRLALSGTQRHARTKDRRRDGRPGRAAHGDSEFLRTEIRPPSPVLRRRRRLG
jgi:hypothetical protein